MSRFRNIQLYNRSSLLKDVSYFCFIVLAQMGVEKEGVGKRICKNVERKKNKKTLVSPGHESKSKLSWKVSVAGAHFTRNSASFKNSRSFA